MLLGLFRTPLYLKDYTYLSYPFPRRYLVPFAISLISQPSITPHLRSWTQHPNRPLRPRDNRPIRPEALDPPQRRRDREPQRLLRRSRQLGLHLGQDGEREIFLRPHEVADVELQEHGP